MFIGLNALLLIRYERIAEPNQNEIVSTRGDVPDFFDHSALTFKLMKVIFRSQEFLKVIACVLVAGLSGPRKVLQHSEPIVAALSAICLLTYQQKWLRYYLTAYTLIILLSCIVEEFNLALEIMNPTVVAAALHSLPKQMKILTSGLLLSMIAIPSESKLFDLILVYLLTKRGELDDLKI